MSKKAIFVGECMIELNGDINSLGYSSSNMLVNFGGDTYNSAVYFSRISNNETETFQILFASNSPFSSHVLVHLLFSYSDQRRGWRNKEGKACLKNQGGKRHGKQRAQVGWVRRKWVHQKQFLKQ